MHIVLLRAIWRILTISFVIGFADLTAFFIFPYLDYRMPAFPALILAYGILAYVFLPLVARFWQIVFRPEHIPRYVTTADGWPADPVNIAIIATSKRHLIGAMTRSGWHQADKPSPANLARAAYAIVFDTMYLTAPFSAFYLFGRKFDIGFQMPIEGKSCPRHRHHVRFWQLRDEPAIDTKNHFGYWIERFRRFLGKKRTIWIGAAIEDTQPVGFRWRNLQLTHHNSHEHTRERDFIIQTLRDTGVVTRTRTITDGEPFHMRSQNVGTSFIVDGNIRVVELKHPLFDK